jgi:hypothetical protein
MSVSLFLLAVTIAAAVFVAIGRWIGLVAFLIAAGIGTVQFARQSSDGFMLVAYGLAFGWPAVLGCIALGSAAGMLVRTRRWYLAIVPLLLPLASVFMQHKTETSEADETRRVTEFAANDAGLRKLTGSTRAAHIITRTGTTDGKRRSYEILIEARNPLYAHVNVDASSGEPKMQLVCVTSLYSGQRDVTKKPCDVDVVPLDDPAWSLLSAPPAQEGLPPVPALPQDVEIYAFGVHHAFDLSKADNNQNGEVLVKVKPGPKPIVLVLANYKIVKWVIDNPGNREIAAVFTSGLAPVTVTGTDKAPVAIGKYFPFELGSPDDKNLQDRVEAIIGKRPHRVWTAYYGGRQFWVPEHL